MPCSWGEVWSQRFNWLQHLCITAVQFCLKHHCALIFGLRLPRISNCVVLDTLCHANAVVHGLKFSSKDDLMSRLCIGLECAWCIQQFFALLLISLKWRSVRTYVHVPMAMLMQMKGKISLVNGRTFRTFTSFRTAKLLSFSSLFLAHLFDKIKYSFIIDLRVHYLTSSCPSPCSIPMIALIKEWFLITMIPIREDRCFWLSVQLPLGSCTCLWQSDSTASFAYFTNWPGMIVSLWEIADIVRWIG